MKTFSNMSNKFRQGCKLIMAPFVSELGKRWWCWLSTSWSWNLTAETTHSIRD